MPCVRFHFPCGLILDWIAMAIIVYGNIRARHDGESKGTFTTVLDNTISSRNETEGFNHSYHSYNRPSEHPRTIAHREGEPGQKKSLMSCQWELM